MNRLTTLILLYIPILANASWLENGEMTTKFKYGRGSDVNTHLSTAIEITPKLSVSFGNHTSGHVSARVRGDEQDHYLPNTPDVSSYTNVSKPIALGNRWLAELRDAYIDIPLQNGSIRLGKQQIVWGALDGIKVLDQLNPQSFEHFILEPFEASRIGLWSAYLDLTTSLGRFEFAAIPDYTTHYLPAQDAWFAFTAPRYRYGQPVQTNSPNPVSLNIEDKRGSIGLRHSAHVNGFDVQFIALSGLDFEPLGRVSSVNANPVFETFVKRRTLFGFGIETSFSAFALRAEVSHTPNRFFNTRTNRSLGAQRLANWRGGIGLDWQAPLSWFINIQYLHDTIPSAPANLIRNEQERLITTTFKRRFNYETVDLELRWYRSLEFKDNLIRARLTYQLSDTITLALAADSFSGNPLGAFGQFRRRDQVTLSLQHTL